MDKSGARTGALVIAAVAAAAVTAASTALVAWLVVQRQHSNSKAMRLYWCLWWKTKSKNFYWLTNVRVPVSVLDQNRDTAAMPADDEGLVNCHIQVKDRMIADVSLTAPSMNGFRTINCENSILLPCFSDAHTHLIKTQTVPRNRNHLGTISEALACEAADQPRWKMPDDVIRRMHFAAQCAIHHGTRAIRTHLDGSANDDPQVAQAVWNAFDEIQQYYQDMLIIQGVANLYYPLWATELAKEYADRASKHKNVVLGAYVGRNTTGNKPDPECVKALDALFGHAIRLEMDVDLHIDESNDPTCCALASLCESLAKARRKGYQGRVVLGHCCALSLQDAETQQRICQELSVLDVYVVSNPFTNLGLQDRRGGKAPHSIEYPADVPRTPQWRGLTLMQELRAAGVPVASASDNVRDHWYPFGDLDMLAVFKMAVEMSHVDLVAGQWANLVTTIPSQAMGLSHHIGRGQMADLIMFPNARRISELFSRPHLDRLVLRKGLLQSTVLPNHSELDDLVAIKTERVPSNGERVYTLSA